MHRGLRPLGAAAVPPTIQSAGLPGSVGADSSSGKASGSGEGEDKGDGKGSSQAETGGEGEGVEGSRAAAKAVEAFIRNNIEAYFGCWTSTYTLFSLDPRLVSGRQATSSPAPIVFFKSPDIQQ